VARIPSQLIAIIFWVLDYKSELGFKPPQRKNTHIVAVAASIPKQHQLHCHLVERSEIGSRARSSQWWPPNSYHENRLFVLVAQRSAPGEVEKATRVNFLSIIIFFWGRSWLMIVESRPIENEMVISEICDFGLRVGKNYFHYGATDVNFSISSSLCQKVKHQFLTVWWTFNHNSSLPNK